MHLMVQCSSDDVAGGQESWVENEAWKEFLFLLELVSDFFGSLTSVIYDQEQTNFLSSDSEMCLNDKIQNKFGILKLKDEKMDL